MPFIAELKHRKPFRPRSDLHSRLSDVVTLLETIRPLEIHQSTKREMLDRALWLVVELSGDFSPQYRSAGVLSTLGVKVQRDHIYPRSTLIKAIIEFQEPLQDIVDRAGCCLVTEEEHHRLSIAPPEILGWDRYRISEIEVHDMAKYVYVDAA